jgi:putative tryptophan/tyrosine transport system substrate-binding protein
MRIKTTVALLVGLGLAFVRLADAQQAKMPKIGWLVTGSASGPRSLFPGVQQELRALGYLEGKNIAIEFRSTEG